tara:strand:+ start:113 stop:667 length:555 start_codon:yes stop_codon:yes gene_type:complete
LSYSQKNDSIKIQVTDSIEITKIKKTDNELKQNKSDEKVNNLGNKKNRVEKSENQTIEYIKSKWIELLGLLIAILAFFIPIYKYLSQKREEQKDKRFETYHKLIADLVNAPGGMLDRQIATVFEFRNFPDYFELSKRILTDLKNQWDNIPENGRLVSEMNLTIAYIERKMKWYNHLLYMILGIK